MIVQIIKLEENDLVAVYKRAGNARRRDEYPVKTFPTSGDLAGKKIITRIFAQNKISDAKEIFEVVKKTNATSFKFAEFQWQVTGPIAQSKNFNRQQLISAEQSIKGITAVLPLDQLHISKFLALASMRPEYQNIQPGQQQEQNTQPTPAQPQSPTGPPPGVVTGGAGGGYYKAPFDRGLISSILIFDLNWKFVTNSYRSTVLSCWMVCCLIYFI